MRSSIKAKPVVLDEYARSTMGLTGIKLPRKAEVALCERFQSLPYQKRFDADELREHFEAVGLGIHAVDRPESHKTIRGDSDLILQISGLIQKLQHMADLQ